MNRLTQRIATLTAIATLPVVYAATPIENANNQAAINIGYIPTQINNSPIEYNSQYLKGHYLGLGTHITKTFEHLYLQFSLDATAGNLSYGHQTFKTTATSFVQTGAIRFGYLYLPNEKIGFTPYGTLGYQYWQIDAGGLWDNYYIKNGFTKFYQTGFYGFGLLTQMAVNLKTVLTLDLTFGKQVGPWLRYNAPDVPNSVIGKNIIYQSAFLASQYFYQAGTAIDYAINNRVHANAGIQYQHAQFASARSSPSNLVQPHLSLSQVNYHAGLGFSLDPANNVSTLATTDSDDIIKANNQASIWLGYLTQNYGETSPGQGFYFDREVGNIPAVKIQFNKVFNYIYTQFNLGFAGGSTAYKSTVSSSPGAAATDDSDRNSLFDSSIRLGYMFFPNDRLGVTPYVAGGYHRWLRDLTGVQDGGFLISGYPETYQFAWYSLGLLTQFAAKPNWVLSIDGNAGTMENVKNKSWTPYLAPRTYQKLLTLKQRFIFNIGVGSDYRFARDWHVLAQANYLYFTFGRSANSPLPGRNYWYEPNSTTRELTLMIGLGYDFA